MKMARTILIIAMTCYSMLHSGVANADQATDVYEISFGPSTIEADPGNPALLVPIAISTTQPVVRINLLLIYDPILVTPTTIAPSMFFQSFIYDISIPGRIKISIITDMPAPPEVPPISGDTTFAWISFRIANEDIGYDYMTHIFYYEDPFTPLPDNYIILQNSNFIAIPDLSLLPADIIIIHPIYGDINANGYAYEIGDAVTFFNYFIGDIHFTRRQYANSDCNRDGLQATISDLVYLLRMINGDIISSISDSARYGANTNSSTNRISSDFLDLDELNKSEIYIESDKMLGGAHIQCSYDNSAITPMAIVLGDESNDLELNYAISPQGKIDVVLLNKNSSDLPGSLKSITIFYKGQFSQNAISISNTDYSDFNGRRIDASIRIDNLKGSSPNATIPSAISLSGYPNPFNADVMIDYNLPNPGNYQICIYDVLGRKVATLFDGYKEAGRNSVHWNAHNANSGSLSSGIYFVRLSGENSSKNLKLFYLK